jgi:hypothetical protein
MTMFINPGSHIAEGGEGWTNAEAEARRKAAHWLTRMQCEGIRDVDLLPGCKPNGNRWVFTYQHQVTGVEVELEIDGIDDYDAYCKRHIFSPKIYWKGSSLGDPQVEDFFADGFEVVKTLRPIGGAA